MKTDHAEDVRKSLRVYLLVGLILFTGTIATALVATVPAFDIGRHGFDQWDAGLGLCIALTKASLVAAVFMHLNHERKMIYWVMTLATMHATGLFIGTAMHFADFTNDRYFYGSAAHINAPVPDHPQSAKEYPHTK